MRLVRTELLEWVSRREVRGSSDLAALPLAFYREASRKSEELLGEVIEVRDGIAALCRLPVITNGHIGGEQGVRGLTGALREPLWTNSLTRRQQKRCVKELEEVLLDIARGSAATHVIVSTREDSVGGPLGPLILHLAGDARPLSMRRILCTAVDAPIKEVRAQVRRMESVPDSLSLTVAQVGDQVNGSELKECYDRAADQEVYTSHFWDEVATGILEGSVSASIARLSGRVVGLTVASHWPGAIRYSLGAFDRQLMAQGMPLGHATLWAHIEYAIQDPAIRHVVLGEEDEGTGWDTKSRNILAFKRSYATETYLHATVSAPVTPLESL